MNLTFGTTGPVTAVVFSGTGPAALALCRPMHAGPGIAAVAVADDLSGTRPALFTPPLAETLA
jgi:hypothetical protein